jgi:hypothetical protein
MQVVCRYSPTVPPAVALLALPRQFLLRSQFTTRVYPLLARGGIPSLHHACTASSLHSILTLRVAHQRRYEEGIPMKSAPREELHV